MKSRSLHRRVAKKTPGSYRCAMKTEAPPPDALRKRTAAKPASTEIPRNAAGWRFAKSVALSTRSRKLPLRIFSAASSTYSAAESMPRAAKGASFSKARAASRMLPANRSTKSPPDRCFSRAWSSSLVRRPGGHVLGDVGRFLELVACHIRRRSQGVASALLHLSPGINHLILQILRGAGILVLAKIRLLGQVQIAHDGLFSGVRVSGRAEGRRHDIVGSLFEFVGHVLRHAAGVPAEIGLGHAFRRRVGR